VPVVNSELLVTAMVAETEVTADTVRSNVPASRLATLAIVARLQPVAAWIVLQDISERNMPAIPLLRSVSSGRPR
jgi:hypothetical protein